MHVGDILYPSTYCLRRHCVRMENDTLHHSMRFALEWVWFRSNRSMGGSHDAIAQGTR
jgi:hypothetical protein